MREGVESGLKQRPWSGQSAWESGGGTDGLVDTEVQAQRCSLSQTHMLRSQGSLLPSPTPLL